MTNLEFGTEVSQVGLNLPWVLLKVTLSGSAVPIIAGPAEITILLLGYDADKCKLEQTKKFRSKSFLDLN